MMKVAIISDIHGNIENYNKFLEYIKDKEIDKIFNLGDFIGGENLDEIINLIRSDSRIITVLGNHDESLIEISDEFKLDISRYNLMWLKSLSKTKIIEIQGKKFLLMHSTIESTTKTPSFYKNKTIEEYVESFSGKYDYICFGHTHVQLCYESLNGNYIINPGSLGLSRNISTEFCILTLDEKVETVEMLKL